MMKNLKYRIVGYLFFQLERKKNAITSISKHLSNILTEEKSINNYVIRR